MCAGQLELAKLCKGTLINLFKINIYIILISSYYLVINNTPMQSIRSNPRPDTLIRNKKKSRTRWIKSRDVVRLLKAIWMFFL